MHAQQRSQGRRWAARGAVALAAGLATLAAAGPVSASPAVTYYVSGAGAGVACTSASPCPLATALTDAASTSDGGDAVTIDLAAGTYGAVAVTAGTESSLTLDGASTGTTVLSGGGTGAVVSLVASIPLTLETVEVTDGAEGISIASGANVAVTVEDSTLTGNTGGGINAQSGAPLLVEDSTLADNQASGAAIATSGTTTASVYGSTIADNNVGVDNSGAAFDLGASILANNSGGDCAGAALASAGDNFADDTTCGSAATHTPSLGLQPLAANGGPTPTIRITATSAAHDTVATTTTFTSQPFCAGNDERGVSRLQGSVASCDAGAYQYAPPVVSGATSAALELGLPITLSGHGLGELTSVSFGGAAATITAETDGSLSLRVPSTLTFGSQPITLTNADGSASVAFDALAGPAVTTGTLAPGELEAPYSAALSTSGGAAPYRYTLLSGALPPGLAMSSAGVVSGTPTKAGGSAFTVGVTDANGISSTAETVSLTIATPVLTIDTTTVAIIQGATAVELSCGFAPCSGTVSLVEYVKTGRAGHQTITTVTLGSGRYALAAAASASVPLTLTPKGHGVLAHAAKHPRKETLLASVNGGTRAALGVVVR